MSKRDPRRLPDFHLWQAVAETVDPLRPKRLLKLASGPLPLPEPVDKKPAPSEPLKKRPKPAVSTMPTYQARHNPKTEANHALEPRLNRKVARGRIEIDGTIDLHGMRQSEAHQALHRFLYARMARGDRTLLVITGKGGTARRLEDFETTFIERGILRAMLPMWLSEPGIAPMIAGWNAAAQGHGGDGAFYVRLRRA